MEGRPARIASAYNPGVVSIRPGPNLANASLRNALFSSDATAHPL